MQEEAKKNKITNRKIADSGGKIVFENPILCSQLLREYSDLEMLKDIKPEDIEDVTERFIPMFMEERDADVVKKVHLNNEDIFIALIEHKSGVDYNVCMQILRYMVYIWEDYEKQQEKLRKGISHTKGFKYPPILPIVYYEDTPEWTAGNFKSRISLSDAFEEYIPNFQYHLISLNKYDNEELKARKDELSLVMLINKIRNAEDYLKLGLSDEYLKGLLADTTNDVLDVISKVVSVVLRKQNIPETEIQDVLDQIKEGRNMALFDNYKGFDVQEERKNGKVQLLTKQICENLQKGKTAEELSDILGVPEDVINDIDDIAEELEYDYNKVYDMVRDKAIQLV